MALTKDEILTAMGVRTQFKLYGLPSSDEMTDILVNALCRYNVIDPVVISATAAIADGETSVVLPSTLRNVQRIFDTAGDEISWQKWTEQNGVITFSYLIGAGTITCYGYAAAVRSSIEDVLAAIPESRELNIMAYCRAFYHDAMGAGDADSFLQKADVLLREASLADNREGIEAGCVFRLVDSQGAAVDPGPYDTDDFTTNRYTDTGMDY